MGQKIFSVLFIVVALSLALYVYRSGILDKVELSDLNFSSTSTATGGDGDEIYIPPNPEPFFEPTSTTYIDPSDIPQGFTAKQLSPYFGKVQIGSFSPRTQDFHGQLSIYAYSSQDEQVPVTGWYVKTNKGNQITIPGGLEIVDPFYANQERDIVLKAGDVLNIYGGKLTGNPLGKNFRLNRCIGYFEDVLDFDPPLFSNCPYVDRRDLARFSGECQDYITSLGSCQASDTSPPVPLDDTACRDFLRDLNYRGCYNAHRFDSDFLDREWRAWVNDNQFLEPDPRHDRLLLFDRNGLLVDDYVY